MRHNGWTLRATDRGQKLVKALRTPSGAHAGEAVMRLIPSSEAQILLRPDIPARTVAH